MYSDIMKMRKQKSTEVDIAKVQQYKKIKVDMTKREKQIGKIKLIFKIKIQKETVRLSREQQRLQQKLQQR